MIFLFSFLFCVSKKETKKEPAIDDGPMAEGSLIEQQYYCGEEQQNIADHPMLERLSWKRQFVLIDESMKRKFFSWL
jgi:hypothetical protein